MPRRNNLTNLEEKYYFKNKMNNKANAKCFNYNNKENFARDYIEPKKIKDFHVFKVK